MTTWGTCPPQACPAPGVELRLTAGPYVVVDGRRAAIPEGGQRLLVHVALHGRRVGRRRVAGDLWPAGDDVRAAASLRSALWRLRAAGLDLLASDHGTLVLREHVAVDVERVLAWADRMIGGRPEPGDLDPDLPWPAATDLLPGWYDEWVLLERERVRQRVLHAVEAMSRQLAAAGRYADAIDVAMAVVRREPLRESARRVLLEAHVAEGNTVEARRCLSLYGRLLRQELGIAPSAGLVMLVAGSPASTIGR